MKRTTFAAIELQIEIWIVNISFVCFVVDWNVKSFSFQNMKNTLIEWEHERMLLQPLKTYNTDTIHQYIDNLCARVYIRSYGCLCTVEETVWQRDVTVNVYECSTLNAIYSRDHRQLRTEKGARISNQQRNQQPNNFFLLFLPLFFCVQPLSQ